VTDDIRTLTARVADEPTSLAFLELAEALRRRGQLEAAVKVARGGLSRYPGLADAHDLMARILSDQGDLAGAFDAWADALRIDPMRTGALKGIAFLYFRAGDVAAAVEHLQRAAEADPDDVSIAQALARVRRESRDLMARAPAPAPEAQGSAGGPAVLTPPEPALAASPPPPLESPPAPVAASPAPAIHASSRHRADDSSSPFAGSDGGQSVVLVDATP
jgi:Flp pilus assembly protein TadD